MRTVSEWIGKNDDTRPPPRVELRLFEKADGRCQQCTRKLFHRSEWQLDHITALINGGKNTETNLQVLCVGACHPAKTKQDVAEKSKVATKRMKHLGIKRTRKPFQGRGFPETKPQHTARRKLTKTVTRIEG